MWRRPRTWTRGEQLKNAARRSLSRRIRGGRRVIVSGRGGIGGGWGRGRGVGVSRNRCLVSIGGKRFRRPRGDKGAGGTTEELQGWRMKGAAAEVLENRKGRGRVRMGEGSVGDHLHPLVSLTVARWVSEEQMKAKLFADAMFGRKRFQHFRFGFGGGIKNESGKKSSDRLRKRFRKLCFYCCR